MTTKTDVKKLLSKGLTGKEAGKLILQDNWLVDHAKDGFLSERDLSSIKASLKTTQDIQDYNSHIETYRIIDYTLKDAHIMALQLQVKLGALLKALYMTMFDTGSEISLMTMPVIMTEKEYQDTKAKQREEISQELVSLDELIEDKAEDITPEEVLDHCPGDEYILAWLKKEHGDLWKQAVSEILDLLKTGNIRPVLITGKDKEELTLLWDRIKEYQAGLDLSMDQNIERIKNGDTLPEEQASKDHDSLYDQAETLIQSLYKAGKGKTDQAGLINSIEKILEGSVSQEEEDNILLYSFCSKGDLYQAGYPDWIKSQIDDFEPMRLEGEPEGVAILVDPKPDQVDKRGYYKRHLSTEEMTEELELRRKDYQYIIKMASLQTRMVLSFQSVIDAVSEVIGIDFGEDIREWIGYLKDIVSEYNRLRLRVLASQRIPEKIKDTLQPINMEKLKPSAQTINYLRDRLARSLGEDWWQDVKEVLVEDFRIDLEEAEHGKED